MKTRQAATRLGLLALRATAILLTAACGNLQGGSPAPTTSGSGASTSSTATSSGTSPSGSTSGTTGQAGATGGTGATPECHAADLKLTLGQSEGTAGTIYVPLIFTNKSNKSCVMVGFPGVSYVAPGNGKQVGAAAQRDGAAGAQVTLKPGASASAAVGMTDYNVFDASVCQPTPVSGFRVYPPDETASMYVALPNGGTGCAGNTPSPQLRVQTIKAGTGQS